MKNFLVLSLFLTLVSACSNRKASLETGGPDLSLFDNCLIDHSPTIQRISPEEGPYSVGTEITWEVRLPSACTDQFEISVDSSAFTTMQRTHQFTKTFGTVGNKMVTVVVRSKREYSIGRSQATITANIAIGVAPPPVTCAVYTGLPGNPVEVIQRAGLGLFLSASGDVKEFDVNGTKYPSPTQPQTHHIDTPTAGSFSVSVKATTMSNQVIDCTPTPFNYVVVSLGVPQCYLAMNKVDVFAGTELTYSVLVTGDVVGVKQVVGNGVTRAFTANPHVWKATPAVGNYTASAFVKSDYGDITCAPAAGINYRVRAIPPAQCVSLTSTKSVFSPGEAIPLTLTYTGTATAVSLNGASVVPIVASPIAKTINAPIAVGEHEIAASVTGTSAPQACAPFQYEVVRDCQRIFVSSEYGVGTNHGREHFTNRCQAMAAAANLGGTWRAVMSNVSSDARDYAAIVGPVCNMNGQTVAMNKDDFWDGSLAAPLNYDQNRAQVPSSRSTVNTGSNASGRYPGSSACSSCSGGPCKRSGYPTCNCYDWSNASDSGTGIITGDPSRTDGQAFWSWLTSGCGGGYRWYCMETSF